MEATVTDQVELFDEAGHLIGVIQRPAVRDLLGPGREKVYLSRCDERLLPSAHAA